MSHLTDQVRLAVENNAWWCDRVCRAGRIATSWQDGFWVARRPSPRFYPEAITLREHLAPAALIDQLPSGGVLDQGQLRRSEPRRP